MYTHPDFARRGVGRLILSLCEAAAREAGFARVELAGTMAGQPLYEACGYEVLERLTDDRGGAPVPLLRMGKALQPAHSTFPSPRRRPGPRSKVAGSR
jgi:GNAT superfamily N-acetyltransferase